MQGQEREVIIYSMTAGDLDYMTEMGDFLYNPNKLNVAFSRAKSKLMPLSAIRKEEKTVSLLALCHSLYLPIQHDCP